MKAPARSRGNQRTRREADGPAPAPAQNGESYAKLYRQSASEPALLAFDALGVYAWLLTEAAHRRTKRDWRGSTITLERGQVAISERAIAKDKRRRLSSYKRLRSILNRLERDELIRTSPILGAVRGAGAGAVGTLITLCHYDGFPPRAISRGAGAGAVGGAPGAQWGRTAQESQEYEEPPSGESARARARARRCLPLPEGWRPSAEAMERGKAFGFTLEALERKLEKFCAYHRARQHQKAICDWDQEWIFWLCRDQEREGGSCAQQAAQQTNGHGHCAIPDCDPRLRPLADNIDRARFLAWIAPLAVKIDSNGEPTIIAPSALVRDRARAEFGDFLRQRLGQTPRYEVRAANGAATPEAAP